VLVTYRLAGSDLENLGRETNRALHKQLLILGTIDKVRRDWKVTLSICVQRVEKENHSHFSRFLTLREVSVMRILWILAAGTGAPVASYSFSPLAT
jgi:hypothetical protein